MIKKLNIAADYSQIIGDTSLGERILNDINVLLDSGNDIEIDMDGVKTMATFCSKQIFGSICLKLGEENFYNRVIIKNASDSLKASIRLGILYALNGKNS